MSKTTSTPYIEYDPASHVYFINGEEVPSITQTLTEIGAIDKTYFIEEHAKRGTLVHLMAEITDVPLIDDAKHGELLDELDTYKTEEMDIAAPFAAQWIKMRSQINFHIEPDGIERKVFDPIHGYAGRLDRYVTIRDGCIEKVLIEIKTNKSGWLPPWAKWQLAAQAHALSPDEIFRRWVIVLTPESWKFHEFPVEEFVSDRDDFLAMVRSVRALRRVR